MFKILAFSGEFFTLVCFYFLHYVYYVYDVNK